MKPWKIAVAIALLLGIAGAIYASIQYNQKGIITVQTGKAVKQDLTSLVTASGEIKPRNYINIGSNAQAPSRITAILVQEGDRVRKGQELARLESVQPAADLAAQRATVSVSEADSASSEAAYKSQDQAIATLEATLERIKSDMQKARLNMERAKKLQPEGLISNQDFDLRVAEVESATAAIHESEARILQAKAQREQFKAQLNSSQKRVIVSQAQVRRAEDVLQRTIATAPLDGMVTNLPVRIGETVVAGIQNSAASLIMTIADMSLITAEVKVDETDIVNVKLNQVANISIDAIPGKTFKGHVIEIGNTAILRSTGLAASQSAISSQEAKDFKVVIALDDPPAEIRPGLSCTSKIITSTKEKVVSIPIQALTVRQKGDLEAKKDLKKDAPAPTLDPVTLKAMKEEVQGVFVISGEKAVFRRVETGITGATDIEVLGGLKEGEEIITGSYKVIRTLKNEAKVKVDNKAPVKAES